MNTKKLLLQETGLVAAGQLICCSLMAGIFAIAGKFDLSVVSGALVGALIATLNFFIMALCAGIAADKAGHQDVKGGQALIQISYMGRLIGLFAILALCAKSGRFNLLALVLPLAFTRPILTIAEFLKKKGGKANEHER